MMKETHMTARSATFLGAFALLLAAAGVAIVEAQQLATPVNAVELIGLSGVKENAKGTLAVEKGNLHFVHAKTSAEVSISSIQDVVTGGDSEKAVGKTIGMISMAAPYGGGRFLSLFRKKIDTLTIQYRDVNGGLHGAIFTMPVGTSDVIKTELLAQGAHTGEAGAVSASSRDSAGQKEKLAQPQEQKTTKLKASAIQVKMIHSDEIKLPAEFQIALYENLIHEIEKQRTFQHVYRDGDHNATTVADLVVLHGTVRGFKAGSEMARQVTTVAGATSINVHCQFTNPDGKSLLERDINGKVRFFGGNLNATRDFAKKAAHVTHESFSSTETE
jgi:hypothetical protein